MAQSNAPIKSVSFRQLFISGIIATVSNLRNNTENGYPFVTLINKKGEATNLYFGKKSAERIGEAYSLGSSILPELKEATVVESTNANGDIRYKLSLKGETEYASGAELAMLFGADEQVGEFDMAGFKATFSAAPAVPSPDEVAAAAKAAADAAKAGKAGKGK